jgi:hypothetical protein
MCDLVEDFILCTCAEENAKSTAEQPDIEYSWTLSLQSYRDRKNYYMGKIVYTSLFEGHGLEWDLIHEKLNAKNCFDFDFVPQHGDVLSIKAQTNNTNEKDVVLTFEYIVDGWQKEKYDVFNTHFKNELKGKLKPLSFKKVEKINPPIIANSLLGKLNRIFNLKT